MRSVAGVAVRDGKAFVARRLQGGSMGGRWEFPGGKVEEGESERDAVAREFDEEFGLPVSVGALLGESTFQNSGKRYELYAFRVGFRGEPSFLREHAETAWLGGGELRDLDLSDSDRSLLPFVLPLLVGVEEP